MSKQELQPPAFVVAATLAGHLYSMMETAKLMLLSACNAKSVAARAGDQALGFRPITDFIADMATDTIHYATRINQLALIVSSASVTAIRTQDGIQRLLAAKAQLTNEQQAHAVDRLIEEANGTQAQIQQHTKETMASLCLQLDEIHQRMRSSIVIVSTSRSEASRAGEFQQYLNSIADNVELAVSELQIEITKCRKLIDILSHTI